MAQIVLVGEKMVRSGMEVGDVISIHEDDVELSGPGYEFARIIKVKGTADQVRQMLFAKVPPRKHVEYWKDKDGTWYVLRDDPKFQVTLKNLATDAPTLTELVFRAEPKIPLQTVNKEITPDKIDLDNM